MRLIEKVWFEKHRARFYLVPLLLPLTIIFWLLSSIRRLGYQSKILPSHRVAAPVIVVGNIGVGGNGKTPLVLWLIHLCRKLGFKPGVVSRGYGGQAPHYPYILDEKSPVSATGDEAYMVFQRTGVDLCIGADRVACAQSLIAQGCNIIITDDGLQHYRLQRDIEFLVVDGKRRFGNQRLLPAGPLREGLWRLKTVDYVVNNGEKPHNNELPMSLIPKVMVNCKTNQQLSVDDFIAAYPEVNAIAGIGSPERFFVTLRHLGLKLKAQQGFVDHHDFSKADLAVFEDEYQPLPLLMTEKDAVKCQRFAAPNWWYLQVDAHLPKVEENLFSKRLQSLVASYNNVCEQTN